MAAPALKRYAQGQSNASGDNLNTFMQTCNNLSELRAFSGTTGMQVFVRGGAVAGDGNAASFFWSDLATADDNGSTIIAPAGAAIGRWLIVLERSDNFISVKDFGALGDSTTDDTQSFQDAIDYCLANDRALYVPSGVYWFALASPPLDPGNGPLAIFGESRETSILYWEGGDEALNSGDEKFLFRNEDNTSKEGLSFRQLTIRGTLETALASGGGNAMRFAYYPSFVCVDCTFEQLRQMGIDVYYMGRFYVNGCTFESISRDACRARDTRQCIITDNLFKRIGDDAIALHTLSSTLETFTPIREGIIITNNLFINAKSIALLGGRKIVFADNYLHLMNVTALSIVSGDGTEGDDTLLDIVISNNTFSDLFTIQSGTAAQGNSYIAIDSAAARGGSTAPNTVAPYQYNSTLGAIVKPWDWYANSNNDLTEPVSPTKGVVIDGNTFGRTLPATAAFSNYGYGTVLYLGTAYDPAITDAVSRPSSAVQITTSPPIGMVISNNRMEHTETPINLPAPTTNFSYKGVRIADNDIFDFTLRGVFVASATFNCGLTIEDNTITGDYYRAWTNSNIDGTYDTNSGLPDGVSLGNCTGIIVRNNTFAWVVRPVFSNDETLVIIKNNICRCGIPAGTSFSASNTGIGNVQTGFERFRYIIEDSNPQSATFGALSQIMQSNASAVPSSGWYFRGHIVWNDAPTIAGKVMGWMKITTGTSNTLGTDWLAMTSA